MTTYVRMSTEERTARENARKRRIREARVAQLRLIIYKFLCWLEGVTTDLPRKVREGTINLFTCTICLILMAALFFGMLGLLELAIRFWGDIYFG